MADLTPEQSIERKLKAFIDDCSPEEQAAFFALLYRAAEEPEVAGFQVESERLQRQQFDLWSYLSNILKKQSDTQSQIISNLK